MLVAVLAAVHASANSMSQGDFTFTNVPLNHVCACTPVNHHLSAIYVQDGFLLYRFTEYTLPGYHYTTYHLED